MTRLRTYDGDGYLRELDDTWFVTCSVCGDEVQASSYPEHECPQRKEGLA